MKFSDSAFQKTMFLLTTGAIALTSSQVLAKPGKISNAGFESGLDSWAVAQGATATTISKKGEGAAKISVVGGSLSQPVSVKVNTDYQLSAYVRKAGSIGVDVAGKVLSSDVENGAGWTKVTLDFNSGNATSVSILAKHNGATSYFDDFKLKTAKPQDLAKSKTTVAPAVEAKAQALSAAKSAPSDHFDLSDWKLSIPTDNDGNGKSDTISERKLSSGYTDSKFFYTKGNGGMAFNVPVKGYRTSNNTKFTRVELREMLRKGNRKHSTQGVGPNNWVFSSAPKADRKAAGAVDGNLTGTVSIDHVTTTGQKNQVGRVVFAQIHAEHDEPIRFYYRKLPNNEKGSIYFAHEPLNEKDIYFEMVGSRSSSAKNPEDGVLLGEKFSYEIDVKGNLMTVKLFRPGKETITQEVDMSESGYDQGGDYMYFKAGAYLQDSTGEPDDFAEVVYYELNNTH